MKQKHLSITSGIPGSGKSTWLKNNCPNALIISRDAIRFALLKKGEDYFSKEDEVLKQFYFEINRALNDETDDREIIVDATHLTIKARNTLFNNLDTKNVSMKSIYYFKVPLSVCLKRNCGRTGLARVPDNVIKRMYHSIVPPMISEGFDTIYYINEFGKIERSENNYG